MKSIFIAVIITAFFCWFLNWQLESAMDALVNVPPKNISIPD